MNKKKILELLKSTFLELKKNNPNIKFQFNESLIVKGRNSKFDSLDTVTFLLNYEKNFKKNFKKNIHILDENFFNSNDNINIKKLINFSLEFDE